MPVVYTPDTEYAKEMRKWNALHTEFGPGERPYVYREYPLQMYKAGRGKDKIPTIIASERAEDEQMRRNLESRGFVAGGQQAAFDALEQQDTVFGELAAEREYAIQKGRVSAPAVKEIRAAEAQAGATHLPDVTNEMIGCSGTTTGMIMNKPRRGRKKKQA